MAAYILDASAVMAFILGEAGCHRVQALQDRAMISAVNYSEVAAKLSERGLTAEDRDTVLLAVQAEIVGFDRAQALESGALRAATRSAGLSLGDRACLALAIRTGGVAITTDRAWSSLDLKVKVELIR